MKPGEPTGWRTVQVVIMVDYPHELAFWEDWCAGEGKRCTLGPDTGCGCCVTIVDISGPDDVLTRFETDLAAVQGT